MNKKLLAPVIIALIVGTGVGYGLGYVIFQPQVSGLESNVSNLQSEVSTLTTNYNDLITSYNDLIENYNSLNLSHNGLFSDHKNLNESYVELLLQYEDLLFHYNLLNGPASNFTTIQDLQITLTTHLTTYYYKDPVSGNVTITYVNGTAFDGVFSIYVVPDFGGYGRTTYHQPALTNGFAEFYLSPPIFRYGSGNYTIGIASISTVEGYVIASGLWDPSVQVEAK